MTEPPKRLKVTFDVPNVIMERANRVAVTCHECRSLVLHTHDPA